MTRTRRDGAQPLPCPKSSAPDLHFELQGLGGPPREPLLGAPGAWQRRGAGRGLGASSGGWPPQVPEERCAALGAAGAMGARGVRLALCGFALLCALGLGQRPAGRSSCGAGRLLRGTGTNARCCRSCARAEGVCPETDCECIQPEFHCGDPQCKSCKRYSCPPGQEAQPEGPSPQPESQPALESGTQGTWSTNLCHAEEAYGVILLWPKHQAPLLIHPAAPKPVSVCLQGISISASSVSTVWQGPSPGATRATASHGQSESREASGGRAAQARSEGAASAGPQTAACGGAAPWLGADQEALCPCVPAAPSLGFSPRSLGTRRTMPCAARGHRPLSRTAC
ncbi:tumor necrosis factor receptor superfamily member 18 isoform X1 [Sus scrofa]|uniref:tumor necrosis factor receptor superfamily member 18 isoform X1 n=1 Tax=Sus scrofa TaxID=9823 RepID=UPI000A2B9443|nr:tumor necrosis factor receptor superfamily member 18 isoform X1 [Sus scrofa]